MGFKLNQHYYEIPPIKKDQSQLQLMSYHNFIFKKDVDLFVEKIILLFPKSK